MSSRRDLKELDAICPSHSARICCSGKTIFRSSQSLGSSTDLFGYQIQIAAHADDVDWKQALQRVLLRLDESCVRLAEIALDDPRLLEIMARHP